jgi:hypothetical protein
MSFIMLVSLTACGAESDNNENVTKSTTSAINTFSYENQSTEVSESEQVTTDNNDIADLLTIKINGTDVLLPMNFDEFLEKTGIETVEQTNARNYTVTDGNGTFEIGVSEEKVVSIMAASADSDEDFSIDTSTTEIIFPGGTTLDTLRTELSGIYPYKDTGTFMNNMMSGEAITDM